VAAGRGQQGTDGLASREFRTRSKAFYVGSIPQSAITFADSAQLELCFWGTLDEGWGKKKCKLPPTPESSHPTSLLAPSIQCGPPSRGSLNKVSSWAASIAVRVNPSRAPGHRVHSCLLCPKNNYSVLLSLLSGCFWSLLTGVTLGSKHIDSSLRPLHLIPRIGVGQQGGRKDLFAFHPGSWWIQSLATRGRPDVDKAKC